MMEQKNTKEQMLVLALVYNEPLRKADAIVILEGDGFARISEGVRLFKEGYASCVVISGGLDNPPHSYRACDMKPKLIEAGVPEDAILLEENSKHTRDQAVFVMNLCKDKDWKSIILVASHYHQPRAFLTFLKAMLEAKMQIIIINAPARNIPWFDMIKRDELFGGELERLETYKNHLATYTEAIEYQHWKEGL